MTAKEGYVYENFTDRRDNAQLGYLILPRPTKGSSMRNGFVAFPVVHWLVVGLHIRKSDTKATGYYKALIPKQGTIWAIYSCYMRFT